MNATPKAQPVKKDHFGLSNKQLGKVQGGSGAVASGAPVPPKP